VSDNMRSEKEIRKRIKEYEKKVKMLREEINKIRRSGRNPIEIAIDIQKTMEKGFTVAYLVPKIKALKKSYSYIFPVYNKN